MFRPGHVTHWNRARENVCVRLSRGAIDILQPAIFDRRRWKATPSIEHLGQWCISLRRNSRREASRWEIYLSLATGGGCHGDASRRIRLPLLLFVKMKTCGIRLLQLIYWSACQTPRNDFSFFISNELTRRQIWFECADSCTWLAAVSFRNSNQWKWMKCFCNLRIKSEQVDEWFFTIFKFF